MELTKEKIIEDITNILERNHILKNKIGLANLCEELKCGHINIAVYDEKDTNKLVSLIYNNDDFDDNDDIVANSDNLFYVSDIIYNTCEYYFDYHNDISSRNMVNENINYLADIIIFDGIKIIKQDNEAKEELIKEMQHISRNWEEMNLNDADITDYPFNESFDSLISDIGSKPLEYVKDVHSKITNWIESL